MKLFGCCNSGGVCEPASLGSHLASRRYVNASTPKSGRLPASNDLEIESGTLRAFVRFL